MVLFVCARDAPGFQPLGFGGPLTWGVAPGWYADAPLALTISGIILRAYRSSQFSCLFSGAVYPTAQQTS
jgi:hypothetical protein